MTGWKQNEALGKPLTGIFNIISERTDQKIESPVTKAIWEEKFYGLADHTILVTKEGIKIPVDIIGSTIKMDGDNIIGIVLIFCDIFERKRIYEVLKN